jgi:menaquinone-dependent protoporphyrinogen oxidase
MSDRILVTYASRSGSTAGVAEEIGKALAEHGAQVDVLPVGEVSDVKRYRAVVAGSAVQGGEWLPEAMQFLRGNRAELAGRPFAAFQVCMTPAMKNGQYCAQALAWLAPVRSLVRPVSEGVFAGAFDIHKVRSFSDQLKFRLAVASGVWPVGDHRDWDTIRRWARQIYPLLSR